MAAGKTPPHTPQAISSSDTTDLIAAYKRGLNYLNRGELKLAEKTFRDIIRRERKFAEAYYGLGLVYSESEPKEALKYFNVEKMNISIIALLS